LELQRQPLRLSEVENGNMGAVITAPFLKQIFPLPNPMTGTHENPNPGSITFPNGFKMSWGFQVIAANSVASIDTSMVPFKFIIEWCENNLTDRYPPKVGGISEDGICSVCNTNTVALSCEWFAAGY